MKEIERKWLINELPDYEPVYIEHTEVGYISTIPEVRVGRYKSATKGKYRYILTFKGEGDLSRTEIQFDIEYDEYEELKKFVNYYLIEREVSGYAYGKYVIECNHIEPTKATSFYYAEVEFCTEEEAMNFEPPDWFGQEVTYDPYYKMKNYWERTRYPNF